MKKSTIAIIIAIIVVLVAVLGVGGFFIVKTVINLTKDKDLITAQEFTITMKGKGYVVADVKDQFSNYDYISNAYVAVKGDYSYQIEFYETTDESSAVSFYNNNKSIFESSKSSVSSENSKDLKNSSKYSLQSNGEYKVVSRIGNTVIYLNVDKDYKDEVDKILDELGY